MLFLGRPNIEKLKQKGNTKALGKALSYEKDFDVINAAALALRDLDRLDVIEDAIEKEQCYNTFGLNDALVEIGRPAAKCFIALIRRGYDCVEELNELGSLEFDPLATFLNVEKKGNDIPLESIDIETFSLDAIDGLGILGDTRAIPILSRIYNSGDSDKKYRAAQSLKEIGTYEAIETLISKFSTDIDKSFSAEAAVEEIGAKAALQLEMAIKGNKKKIKKRAQEVLKAIHENEEEESRKIAATNIHKYTLNPNSVGCPYLRQNACHFRQLSSKKQSGDPDKCSLEVNGYKNCHVWAIEPK